MLDIAAIAGERPPRTEFLPFSPPSLGPEEKAELLDTLDSGWITTGPKTEHFAEKVAEYVGAKYAMAVNSCTAALHLSVVASGITEGNEVIMPTYTFASTGHVVLYERARPVFVDIDPVMFNLDPSLIEGAITPRTRAIMPVHYGGQACDLDAIYAIAHRHNLVVIEDAAHAIGTEHKGRKIGGSGNPVCFSFYATKNMTTGEGGMIVTDDRELAQRLQVMSMYGISDARRIWARYAPRGTWFYDIPVLGFKYNMMDIQAALGLAQLAKLEGFIARRGHFARMYEAGFGELEEIILPKEVTRGRHAWHLYSIVIRPETLTIGRDEFIEELKAANIGTSVMFRPLHLHSLYRDLLGTKEGDFPKSEWAFQRTISLPIAPKMSDDDVLDVIGAVRRIIAKHRR